MMTRCWDVKYHLLGWAHTKLSFSIAQAIVGYELVIVVFPFLKVMEYGKSYSISNISRVAKVDLKVISLSLSHTLSVLSNNSGLLIHSTNCNWIEYMCGPPPCVWLVIEGE